MNWRIALVLALCLGPPRAGIAQHKIEPKRLRECRAQVRKRLETLCFNDSDKFGGTNRDRALTLALFTLCHHLNEDGKPVPVDDLKDSVELLELLAEKTSPDAGYTAPLNFISCNRLATFAEGDTKLIDRLNAIQGKSLATFALCFIPAETGEQGKPSVFFQYSPARVERSRVDFSIMQFLALGFHELASLESDEATDRALEFWKAVEFDLGQRFFPDVTKEGLVKAHLKNAYGGIGTQPEKTTERKKMLETHAPSYLNRTLAAMVTYYLACEHAPLPDSSSAQERTFLTKCNSPLDRESPFSLDKSIFGTMALLSQQPSVSDSILDRVRKNPGSYVGAYGLYALERMAEYAELTAFEHAGRSDSFDWYEEFLPTCVEGLEGVLDKKAEEMKDEEWWLLCFYSLFIEKASPVRIGMRQLSQFSHGSHFHLQSTKKVNRDVKLRRPSLGIQSARPLSIFSASFETELKRSPVAILTARDELPPEFWNASQLKAIINYLSHGGILVVENSSDSDEGAENYRNEVSQWVETRLGTKLLFSDNPPDLESAVKLVNPLLASDANTHDSNDDGVVAGNEENSESKAGPSGFWGVARTHGFQPNIYYFDLPLSCVYDKFCSADAWCTRGTAAFETIPDLSQEDLKTVQGLSSIDKKVLEIKRIVSNNQSSFYFELVDFQLANGNLDWSGWRTSSKDAAQPTKKTGLKLHVGWYVGQIEGFESICFQPRAVKGFDRHIELLASVLANRAISVTEFREINDWLKFDLVVMHGIVTSKEGAADLEETIRQIGTSNCPVFVELQDASNSKAELALNLENVTVSANSWLRVLSRDPFPYDDKTRPNSEGEVDRVTEELRNHLVIQLGIPEE